MSAARLLRQDDSVLLIVDLQERLLAAMPEAARETVLRNSRRLLSTADTLGVPRLYTQQYPRGLGPTVAGIAELLPAGQGCDKTAFSCCGAENFGEALRQTGRRQVVIAGIEAHVCVLATALDLRATGHEVHVIEDACCSRHREHHDNAMQRLRAEGVVISNHESALFEWLRDASHPQFKTVTALLRP